MAALDQAVATLAPAVGTVRACRAVGQPRASWYRRHRQSPATIAALAAADTRIAAAGAPSRRAPAGPGRAPRRAVLRPGAGQRLRHPAGRGQLPVLDLDDVPAAARPGRNRRPAPARHPPRPGSSPSCWRAGPTSAGLDITKLAGPAKWTWYYLYVILDIYSRYAVGWMVAYREAALLAERLLADTIAAQGVKPAQLTIHADRGTSMTSKPVAMLLADLGVTRSHARPHVPDDNPTARASSRPSSTIRPSPSGSAASRTRERSAGGSSAGTTASTATAGSRC
jgi:putative transposase